MSTASKFTQRLTIADIPSPAMSVGAHLAAKLQLFCTDERTLTDELCDMLCIWLGMEAVKAPHKPASIFFDLTISKTTTSQEVKTGADLELIIQSPLGKKRCLIQAKVLDPIKNELRCNSKSGWKKLRKQLVNARKEVGDLAFLLIYVPMNQLNGYFWGYGTHEQKYKIKNSKKISSAYGATLIPANKLIGANNRWRYVKEKVKREQDGSFTSGKPFWIVLLELMLCKIGTWDVSSATSSETGLTAVTSLKIEAGEIDKDKWVELQQRSDEFLDEKIYQKKQKFNDNKRKK